MESDAEIRADLRDGVAACQHQTGVDKYSMSGAVRAPKHRMRGVCARHTDHTVQGIKRDTKRENVL